MRPTLALFWQLCIIPRTILHTRTMCISANLHSCSRKSSCCSIVQLCTLEPLFWVFQLFENSLNCILKSVCQLMSEWVSRLWCGNGQNEALSDKENNHFANGLHLWACLLLFGGNLLILPTLIFEKTWRKRSSSQEIKNLHTFSGF